MVRRNIQDSLCKRKDQCGRTAYWFQRKFWKQRIRGWRRF